jgi:transposase
MDETNRNRIEGFRQFKRDVRGSEEYLLVGIDIAKEKHHAFFGTATGKTLLKCLIFDNSREGFERLLIQVEALKVYHGLKRVVMGMEPTANYHKPLGEYLIRKGYEVVLVGGVAVKRNRELLDNRWDKHDTKDAANVADLISQGKCLFYEYPTLALRELKDLLSLKRRLKKQEHGYQLRIRNHFLAQYFPEMDSYYEQSKVGSLGVVKWCLCPSKISEMGFNEFVRLVSSRRVGIVQERRLRVIWEKARESIGCEAGETVAFGASLMVDELRQSREALKATEAKIEEVCKGFSEYECLLSIPGFGPDVSSKVLGAIGDPFRFQNGHQVLKLAGYDLSADRSGKESEQALPVISKKGKADLRYALYQAAHIASSKHPGFMTYYTGKLRGRQREQGIQTKMKVKLAAKLLIIAWTLMKRKECFDPSYLNLA